MREWPRAESGRLCCSTRPARLPSRPMTSLSRCRSAPPRLLPCLLHPESSPLPPPPHVPRLVLVPDVETSVAQLRALVRERARNSRFSIEGMITMSLAAKKRASPPPGDHHSAKAITCAARKGGNGVALA
eukprot:scaffold133273_cov71-Phaeocystis_antarctica.AAC.2